MTATATGVARVVEREWMIFRHLWRGPVVLSFITPVMFLAAMGLGLGELVDEGGRDLGGQDYLGFVTPGLLVASGMQVAAGESLWPVMAGKKWMGTFHAMVASPLSAADVFGGFVVWNGIRTAISAAAFLAVAALLGGVTSLWAPLAVLASVGCATAISALLAAFAIAQDTDITFTVFMRLGIMPMFLFSGTFFPVEQLPDVIRPLALISPLWHGVELARAATTGQGDSGALVLHGLALGAFIAVGWIWGTRRFTTELQP